jgi:F-type H+-transporting ATPase subunit epsilon
MAEKLPSQISVEIVTPERQYFCGEVDAVTVPGREGYMGILPGHAPLLSELKIGVITIRRNGREEHFFCSWGFVEVLTDRVSILAEAAEKPEEIDPTQVRADKEEAEGLLRSRDNETDFQEALERWEKAVARLQITNSST